MSGGLLQIITSGIDDIFLTGLPEVTFFRFVYRRHTIFSMESIQIPFENVIIPGRTSDVTLPYIGDLIHKTYVEIVLPNISFKVPTTDIMTSINYKYEDIKKKYNTAKNNLRTGLDYMKLNMDAYKKIMNYYSVDDINTIDLKIIFDGNDYIKGIKSIFSNVNKEDLIFSDGTIIAKNSYPVIKFKELLQKSNDSSRFKNTSETMLEKMNKYIKYGLIKDPNEPTTVKEITDKITQYTTGKIYIDSIYVCIDEIIDKIRLEYSDYLTHYVSGVDDDNTRNKKKEAISVFKNYVDTAYNHSIEVIRRLRENLRKLEILYNDINTTDTINKNFAWVKNLGFSMIDNIELKIGEKIIDKHYGIWLYIWHELNGNYNSRKLFDRMIGNVPELTNFDRNEKPKYTLMVPLIFPFNRFSGLSLPVTALQYNTINLSLKFKKFSECCYIEPEYEDDEQTKKRFDLDSEFENKNFGYEAKLYVEYIFLDKHERTKFIKSSNEYIIEQLQYIHSTIDGSSLKIDPEPIDHKSQEYYQFKEDMKIPISEDIEVEFNHPCKEFIWVAQKNIYVTNNEYGDREILFGNFTANRDGKDNPILTTGLTFNGYERFKKYDGMYFNYLQPWAYHKNTPSDGINVYSFANNPEELQPSGTCNLSRIKSTKFLFDLSKWLFITNNNDSDKDMINENNPNDKIINIHIFAINYNILRIVNGCAGIAYF